MQIHMYICYVLFAENKQAEMIVLIIIVVIAVKNWIGVIAIDTRRNSKDYQNHG